MKFSRYSIHTFFVMFLVFLSPSAFAQVPLANGGVMNFSVANIPVSTLSTTMLIVMSILLATIGYLIIKKGDKIAA